MGKESFGGRQDMSASLASWQARRLLMRAAVVPAGACQACS